MAHPLSQGPRIHAAQRMITVGCSEVGFSPVAEAFHTADPAGGELDSMRSYATLDTTPTNYSAWEGYAKFGTRVDLSMKPKRAGKMIPITDVWPGKDTATVAQIQTWLDVMAALPHRETVPGAEADPYLAVFNHEGDAATAAQGGTPEQIDDAIKFVADMAYATPGFASNCMFGVCLTGFQVAKREPPFHPGLSVSEFGMFDPYLQPGQAWASFDQIVGPIMDYMTAQDPNLYVYLGEFGCDPRPGRATWLHGIPGAILTPRYKQLRGISYFNEGINAVTGQDLSALAAVYVSIRGK